MKGLVLPEEGLLEGKETLKRACSAAARREPMGNWESLGDPCIGGTLMARSRTFFSQVLLPAMHDLLHLASLATCGHSIVSTVQHLCS